MLHTLKDLEDFSIHATDGDIGKAQEFYFDDKQWIVRYLVVETNSWLASRKVLLSPSSIRSVNRENKSLSASMSREQVKTSPDIDTQKPVSRQRDDGSGLWADQSRPYMIAPGYATSVAPQPDEGIDTPDMFSDVDIVQHRDDDRHLHSNLAVAGYCLEATDGELGHVEGMIVDTETWTIRYLIVNTSNWWVGRLVLITPRWITEVSWFTSKFYVDMTRQQVKDAPIFDPAISLSREHEKELHRHYGRNGYWED